MLETITKLREKLAGKKTYALIAVAVIVAVVQFLFGVDLGMSELKPATNIMELLQQLWDFAIVGTLRGAIAGAAVAAAVSKE